MIHEEGHIAGHAEGYTEGHSWSDTQRKKESAGIWRNTRSYKFLPQSTKTAQPEHPHIKRHGKIYMEGHREEHI